MYQYDGAQQTLTIRQKDLGKHILTDLVTPIKEAYNKYVSETVYDDMHYLEDQMRILLNTPDLTITNVRVVMEHANDAVEAIPDEKKYYAVYGDINVPYGCFKAIKLHRFPMMDNDGCLAGKVVVHELVRLEDISYSVKDKHSTLSVVFPKRSMSIITNGEGDTFLRGYNKARLHVYDMLVAAFNDWGYCPAGRAPHTLNKIFKSPQMTKFLNKFYKKLEITSKHSADTFVGIDGTLKTRFESSAFELGRARNVICRHLSLDKALGHTLSDPVPMPKDPSDVIPAGTIIDNAVLTKLKQNGVNRIMVDHLPILAGKKLSELIQIRVVKKGTIVTDFLRERYPALESYSHVPEDFECNLIFDRRHRLTQEDLELMKKSGVKLIFTEDGDIPYEFKHEIVTNNFISVRDLYHDRRLPDSSLFSNNDYLYMPTVLEYGDSIDVAVCSPAAYNKLLQPFLTVDDLIALVAYKFGIRNLPETFIAYDRDEDFLKKVLSLDETLSKTFREQLPIFIKQNQIALRNFLGGKDRNAGGLFYKLSENIRTTLIKKSVFRTVDKLNPLAVLSSIRQVGVLGDNSSVNQRSIVMGHSGRLDPYETPAGKKIGLNTTLCANSRIRDGHFECAYHPVYKSGNKSVISHRIEWLTQLDEMAYKIGDIMTIETIDGNMFESPIVQRQVIAKIPAPTVSKEKTVVGMVDATQLDYVTVSDTQTLGVGAQLIPFLGADDGVRVSYAVSMLKQAVNLYNSEVPLVSTSMYRRMFDENDTYILKAKEHDSVSEITSSRLFTENGSSYSVKESIMSGSSFCMLDYRVKDGDSFKKGDVLADSTMSREGYFSPGVNLFVAYAPFYGYNNEDAIPISERAALKLTSLEAHQVTKEIRVRADERMFISKMPSGYYSEDSTVFQVNRQSLKSRTAKPALDVKVPTGKSGILYSNRTETASSGFSRKHTASLVDISKLHEGDKVVGRHGNKSTTSRVVKNSKMPMFPNGVVIDVCQNPCGLPSRMNLGQQLEAIFGMVAWMFEIRIVSDSFNGGTREDANELWNFMLECIESDNLQGVFSNYPLIPAGVKQQAVKLHEKLKQWRGCLLPGGHARLINQITGKEFEYPISVGVGYYMKLHHEVMRKMHARPGLVGVDYTALEHQPPRGAVNHGGQRFGEMEFDALHAYGAYELSREMLNEKSDNILLRDQLTPKMLDPNAVSRRDLMDSDMYGTATRCSEYFRYITEAMGVNLEYSDGYPLDHNAVTQRKYLRNQKMPAKVVKEQQVDQETLDELAAHFGMEIQL